MIRKICTILIVLMGLWAAAQPPINLSVAPSVVADSADIAYYGKKHFWRAAGEVFGMNMAVWTYDRYIQNADFAHISFNTIGENFKHWLIWDNDQLSTNMFMHPYHGSLYFNAGRSNGYNYWQSGLFALSGSFMWEFFMENEYPSTNDIVATPVGGMALGEVFYRMSDIVLNDRSTGWQRFGREVAAFVISPMRGLTRIINGDAWRHRPTTGRQFGIPNIAFEISTGVRALEFNDKLFDNGIGFTTALSLEYGDRFEPSASAPYDYFTMRADLDIQPHQPIIDQVNILGRLYNHELMETRNVAWNVGVYQCFDFYDSDTISDVSRKVPYRLAAPASVGVGSMFRTAENDRCTFDAFAGVNAVILGGVLTDYYNVGERSYNLGSGFSIKAGANAVFGVDKFSLAAMIEWYRIFTWKGYPEGTDFRTVNERTLNAQGDPSESSFVVSEFRADYRLSKHFYLTGALSLYSRRSHYKGELPNVHSTSTSTRLMLTYKF